VLYSARLSDQSRFFIAAFTGVVLHPLPNAGILGAGLLRAAGVFAISQIVPYKAMVQQKQTLSMGRDMLYTAAAPGYTPKKVST
jgi:hypothetical protein